MNDLRDAIRAFTDKRDWEQFHSPKNLAMALSVEVSEVAEHFQWLTEEQSQKLPSEKLAEVREEIGDVMIYLTELAGKLEIEPVEAAKAKMRINEEKYPATLVRGKATHSIPYATCQASSCSCRVSCVYHCSTHTSLMPSFTSVPSLDDWKDSPRLRPSDALQRSSHSSFSSQLS